MPKSKKGQRADGRNQVKSKMPVGKYKEEYGKRKTEEEAK